MRTILGGEGESTYDCNAIASNNPQRKQCAMDIRVAVIPCVGDESYARRQMMSLTTDIFGTENGTEERTTQNDQIPAILPPAPEDSYYFGQTNVGDQKSYYRFGEPHVDILRTFRQMEENGVVLDLLYGAPCWTVLLRHFRTEPRTTHGNSNGSIDNEGETTKVSHRFDPRAPLAGREVMYVHSGGLEGINSQLMRYKYNGLVNTEEVQLPGRR